MSFGYTVLGFGSGDTIPDFSIATGGSIVTSGDYKIHTFTSSGNFVFSAGKNKDIEYLVVAGGGGGSGHLGGGGGAGAGKCRAGSN